ncbi:hypothetical protein NL676_018480 [Syzygium grande]|nr:hypothetical protein NL676_018480 [Syzygium grande]
MSTGVPARVRKGTDQTWGERRIEGKKGQGNPEERVQFEFGASATESTLQLHTPFVQRVAHHMSHQSSRPFIDTTLEPPPPRSCSPTMSCRITGAWGHVTAGLGGCGRAWPTSATRQPKVLRTSTYVYPPTTANGPLPCCLFP